MLKIWGRNTSSNVQKAMWAIGEMGLKYERIDIEPDVEYIRKMTGLSHAFVAWIPYSLTDIPKPWRRLWMTDHFEETGYAQLVEG